MNSGRRVFGNRRIDSNVARLCIRIIIFSKAGFVFLKHCRHDIDALRLQFGFFGRPRDVDCDCHRYFGVKLYAHFIQADRLDRLVENDLILLNLRTLNVERLDDVAHRD